MTRKDIEKLNEAYSNRITLRNIKGTKQGEIFGPQSYEVIVDGRGVGYIGWSGDSWGYYSLKTNQWDWDKSLQTKAQAAKKLLQTL
jgi:hypothetical protein